jgi:hypothetical protein
MSTDLSILAEQGIPLSDMIETLRSELQQSVTRGQDQPISLRIDKVELELKVAVSRKAKGGLGVAFWVLKADAGAEGQLDHSHTFKLTLSPVDRRSGGELHISSSTTGGPQTD